MTGLPSTVRQFWIANRSKINQRGIDQADFVRLYFRGQALARSGSFRMAVSLYQQALDLEPMLDEALEGMGQAFDALGLAELAAEKYEAARRIRAGRRLGPPDRHYVLRQRGHFKAEVLAYDVVIGSLKKNTFPYIARGNAYLAAGQPQEALVNYDHAIKLKGKLPDILVLRGEALSKLGRYGEAAGSLSAALEMRPHDAEALGGRAIARIGQGMLNDANGDWRRQFELLEGRPAARACVALRMADWGLALPELERTLQKEPNDPYWHLYCLTARRRLGMPTVTRNLPSSDRWPDALLALHIGRAAPDEVLKQAYNDDRRAEAMFQLGVLAFDKDRKVAEQYWRELVECSSPSLIEHAAANNELARLPL